MVEAHELTMKQSAAFKAYLQNICENAVHFCYNLEHLEMFRLNVCLAKDDSVDIKSI